MDKVTENTTIKELAPEGYEFDWCDMDDVDKSCIIKFKKNNKSFNEYVDLYLSYEVDDSFTKAVDWMVEEDIERLREFFKQEVYSEIPLEFKLGLLKLICDDLDIYYWDVIAFVHDEGIDCDESFVVSVLDVCPKEFIVSIV